MELKTSRKPLGGLVRGVPWIRAAAVGSVLVVGALLFQRTELGGDAVARARDAGRDAANLVASHLRAAPTRLQLDVAHENFEKLAAKRRVALEEGVLVSSPDDFVPGRASVDGGEVRVKLRLKGDLSDHWEDEHKWSFRIVVKGEDTLLGMKQFSVQQPRTRGNVHEWFMHEALRSEGLPALRYDFVQLVLNGRDLGIYALEEHFEKRLVENRGRREGPIVRFDEDLCWDEIRQQLDGIARDAACQGSGAGSWLVAGADAFQTTRLMADPESARQVVKALQLLDGWRRGELAVGDAFDADLLARHFAVLEALDRVHATYWRNLRFYYNPITSRLEPIAFDGGSVGQPPTPALLPALRSLQDPLDPAGFDYHLSFVDAFFRDESFYARYVRELERVSADGWLEGLLEELRPALDEKLLVLHREFPSVDFDETKLFERRRLIRSWLSPTRAVRAHVRARRNGHLALQVGNLQYLSVELLGLDRGGKLVAPLPEPVVLPGRSVAHAAGFTDVLVPLPERAPGEGAFPEGEQAGLELRHRILGSSRERGAALLTGPVSVAREALADASRAPANAAGFDFAVADEAEREIRIEPGIWFLRRDLIAPEGWRLRAGPGTEILLEDGAMILARGPVVFVGSEESPVAVRSASGRGQGLLVIGAGEPSVLEHVRFERLAAPSREGLAVTGAVTFYDSPVTIRRAQFAETVAEDALNLVRSDFEISESVFRASASDALDADFCTGRIVDTSFVGSGNDAIDVSGSAVRLERVRISGAGDKGLSAGEQSEVRGGELRVRGANVGLASKDLSRVVLEGVTISDSKVGLAAFQKKSEFGGAHLQVDGLELEGVERAHLVESGSAVFIDGERVDEDEEGVQALLYADD